MNPVRIKAPLKEAVTSFKKQRFTVGDLTQRYLNHPDCGQKTQKAARQYVYRNLLRLIESGHIERFTDDQWPCYLLLEDPSVPVTKKASQTPAEEEKEPVPSSHLKDRLRQHRSDMLCALGEAEEYNALCREIPTLRDEAQILYNEARERSDKLLGRIKALESLLSTNH